VSRPERLVLLTGTGTEVGKTWTAVALATGLRARRLTVAARKPVQSYEPGTGPTDAERLAIATGEEPAVVCPVHRWYEKPLAPFFAAALLDREPFTVDLLVDELRWPDEGVAVGVVESAGGVRSPLTRDGCDTLDLARALAPDKVLLVADAGLGALNAVRLCLDALADLDLQVVVFLNRYEGTEVQSLNFGWLTRHAATPVITDVAALVDELLR
jgi:dethiobiotin synthetase